MLCPHPEGRPTGPLEARPEKNPPRLEGWPRAPLVAILRDAREERAPQDEDNTSLQGGFRACAKWRIPEWRRLKFIVMPALVAGIHVFLHRQGKTWMAGTKPGHDENGSL